VIAVDVVKRICDDQSDLITALESTISDHEEDSAALPEDMSITETIKMKDKRIDTLALALQLIQDAYNDGTTASDTITFQVQDYVDLAETELKEATDE